MILAAVPLAMMFIDGPLSTLQTLAIVTSLPLMVVIFIMLYGFFKWIGNPEQDSVSNAADEQTDSIQNLKANCNT